MSVRRCMETWSSASQCCRSQDGRRLRRKLDRHPGDVQEAHWVFKALGNSAPPRECEWGRNSLSGLQTFRSGWLSTSPPCSGARPSCTGTLAKAQSNLAEPHSPPFPLCVSGYSTYTILGVPYYDYNIVGPKTLFVLLRTLYYSTLTDPL